MILPLPHIKAISIVGKKTTVGSEPLHVIGDDYNAWYVKNNKQLSPASYLINEVIAHYFLKVWNVNTPDIALVNMPKETLFRDWGSMHKKSYYHRMAFGSKEVDGAFDLTEIATIKGKTDFRKYAQPTMLGRIGLFDMWIENEDRPPDLKNLMLFEKEDRFHFLAIDNAMALRTGAYGTLTEPQFYATENNYCLQSTFFQVFKRYVKALNKNWAIAEEENFYLCVNNCKQCFSEIARYLPAEWGYSPEIEQTIYKFLFNEQRNKQVFNEYIRLYK